MMRARDYQWLTCEPDPTGDPESTTWFIDLRDTTSVEMDRRMVIMQEVSSGRLALANGVENVDAEH